MFQFLIGSLVTLTNVIAQVDKVMFQFLIGSLVTITYNSTKKLIGIVSIPYR